MSAQVRSCLCVLCVTAPHGAAVHACPWLASAHQSCAHGPTASASETVCSLHPSSGTMATLLPQLANRLMMSAANSKALSLPSLCALVQAVSRTGINSAASHYGWEQLSGSFSSVHYQRAWVSWDPTRSRMHHGCTYRMRTVSAHNAVCMQMHSTPSVQQQAGAGSSTQVSPPTEIAGSAAQEEVPSAASSPPSPASASASVADAPVQSPLQSLASTALAAGPAQPAARRRTWQWYVRAALHACWRPTAQLVLLPHAASAVLGDAAR